MSFLRNEPVSLMFRPWAWEENRDDRFALLVAACGYEQRSKHAAKLLMPSAERLLAYAYEPGGELSYEENHRFFESAGDLVMLPVETIGGDLAGRIAGIKSESDRPLRVAVDISSMDRDRLAAVVRGIVIASANRTIDVTFVYSEAEFESGQMGSEGAVVVNRPLLGFAGWNPDPDVPLACILGMGFEKDLALAALETLEASRTILFRAVAEDSRYEERVVSDNGYLMKIGDPMIAEYDVGLPLSTVLRLDEIVYSLIPGHRVVIVPLGPKTFALASILIALKFGDAVAVWRVSSAESRTPEDRVASGRLVGLSVRFQAPDSVA